MTALLLDNGSTQAAAVLQLRRLAAILSAEVGDTVYPVSLRHADSIDPAALAGEPALVLKDFLRARLEDGARDFTILPLFFGPARALAAGLPQTLAEMREIYGGFSCRVAKTLYPLPAGDGRLAQILYEHTLATMRRHQLDGCPCVLTDHGSPTAAVTQTRSHIARRLRGMFGAATRLAEAAMEPATGGRGGPGLKDCLDDCAARGDKNAVVIMQFLLPGRHAGAGGDVGDICRAAARRRPGFRAVMTPLVGEHPLLVDILASRLNAVDERRGGAAGARR